MPVHLSELQGMWLGSGGTTVEVRGQELLMNGFPVGGGLRVEAGGEDPCVVGYGVFRPLRLELEQGICLWHTPGNTSMGEIVWRRSDEDEVSSKKEAMQSRMGERAAICGGQAFSYASEQDVMLKLSDLIRRWHEKPSSGRGRALPLVRSCDICPDWTNRAQTGLSVEHVHFLANRMLREGFLARRASGGSDSHGHDIPVLVRERSTSDLGRSALAKWHDVTEGKDKGRFPPFLLGGAQVSEQGPGPSGQADFEFFCSLGNGHFSQALNLFRLGLPNIFAAEAGASAVYEIGTDAALRGAVEEGVESIVLSSDIPVADRRFVSEMLNRTHGQRWRIGTGSLDNEDFEIRVDREPEASAEAAGGQKSEQFVALSKVLDSEELSCLVRNKLGAQLHGDGEAFLVDMSHLSA